MTTAHITNGNECGISPTPFQNHTTSELHFPKLGAAGQNNATSTLLITGTKETWLESRLLALSECTKLKVNHG